MKTLAEIETAADSLSPAQQQELVRHLLARLNSQLAVSSGRVQAHSILDIEPVCLGRVLQPMRPDDDLLGEMLEGHV